MRNALWASTKDEGPVILLKRRYDTIDHYVHVWGVVTCSGDALVPGEAPHQFLSAAKAAEKVFDEMPGRNVVLWNSTICDLMEFEFNSKPAHTSLIHDGLGLNVVASTALADFHCKWDKISNARQVFDDMPHKSIVSFSAMIHGFANNGLYGESLQRFLDMQRTCIHPNHGMEIAWIAYATCGRVIDSYMVFAKMNSPILISGHGRISAFVLKNALIAELNQFKNEKVSTRDLVNSIEIKLMDDFLEMERLAALPEIKNSSSTSPSKVETDALQQQLIELQRKLDLVDNSKQLAMLEVVNAEERRRFLESQLESSQVEVRKLHDKDVISRTMMIGLYLDIGGASEVLEVIIDMRAKEVEHDNISLVDVTSACAVAGVLRRGSFRHFNSLEVLCLHGINFNDSMLQKLICNFKVLKRLYLRAYVSWKYIRNSAPNLLLKSLVSVCLWNTQLIEHVAQFLLPFHFSGKSPSLYLLNTPNSRVGVAMISSGDEYFKQPRNGSTFFYDNMGIRIITREYWAVKGEKGQLDRGDESVVPLNTTHHIALELVSWKTVTEVGNAKKITKRVFDARQAQGGGLLVADQWENGAKTLVGVSSSSHAASPFSCLANILLVLMVSKCFFQLSCVADSNIAGKKINVQLQYVTLQLYKVLGNMPFDYFGRSIEVQGRVTFERAQLRSKILGAPNLDILSEIYCILLHTRGQEYKCLSSGLNGCYQLDGPSHGYCDFHDVVVLVAQTTGNSKCETEHIRCNAETCFDVELEYNFPEAKVIGQSPPIYYYALVLVTYKALDEFCKFHFTDHLEDKVDFQDGASDTTYPLLLGPLNPLQEITANVEIKVAQDPGDPSPFLIGGACVQSWFPIEYLH